MSTRQQDFNPFVMVMFGATGDLAKRKLFAALYGLYRNNLLHENFAVVGVGRSPMELDAFRAYMKESVATYGRIGIDDEAAWNEFEKRFDYVAIDVTDPSAYEALRVAVEKQEKTFQVPGNRVFYMALAPELFGTVANNLKAGGLKDSAGFKRLVIEKPFGKDFESAKALNEQIQKSFSEDEIYRIDHYLGKEMVQNIEVIRFANTFFEGLWNNRYIENIQITASETVGVEERAGYYEHAGALKDMVQNHMLQMVMMVCMEPPSSMKMEAVRDEKVKVLRSLRRYSEEEVPDNVVRGQYDKGVLGGKEVPDYRSEHNVDPNSDTETFVAAKLFVDNFRWAGVPIYIRTGKRLKQKATEIVVQFKSVPKNLLFNQQNDLGPNLLVIRINPMEGVYFLFNAKRAGSEDQVAPIAMEYCNNCMHESPEAYERLFYDAIQGDSTFFTRWDEVSLAWKFVDPIRRAWDSDLEGKTLKKYPSGSMGPVEADKMLEQDGAHWWPVSGKKTNEEVISAIEQDIEAMARR